MTLNVEDVRMGDTVRLVSGETIVVSHVSLAYEDRSGLHEGPWVSARGGRLGQHHLNEVVEVVAVNPYSCKLCGDGCTSNNPEKYPYCKNCHYTGAAAEDVRAGMLAEMKEISGADEVGIWHTGGGCFQLTFTWKDTPHYSWASTDGEASLPSDEDGNPIRDGWGWVGRYFYNPDNDQGSSSHPDYEGSNVLEPTLGAFGEDSDRYWNEYPAHCLTDQQVAEAARDDHWRLTREAN